MGKYFKIVRRAFSRAILWLMVFKDEKRVKGTKLKYIHQKSPKNKELMIIFSAMDKNNNRRYHYLKNFKNLGVDLLYILDPYGYRGSYWLYENGKDYPQKQLLEFLGGGN